MRPVIHIVWTRATSRIASSYPAVEGVRVGIGIGFESPFLVAQTNIDWISRLGLGCFSISYKTFLRSSSFWRCMIFSNLRIFTLSRVEFSLESRDLSFIFMLNCRQLLHSALEGANVALEDTDLIALIALIALARLAFAEHDVSHARVFFTWIVGSAKVSTENFSGKKLKIK